MEKYARYAADNHLAEWGLDFYIKVNRGTPDLMDIVKSKIIENAKDVGFDSRATKNLIKICIKRAYEIRDGIDC